MTRIPASEVIRQSESEIGRAAQLREQAKRILEQAASIEREARSSAVIAMGQEKGEAAFRLAVWSVYGNDAALEEQSVANGGAGLPVVVKETSPESAADPHFDDGNGRIAEHSGGVSVDGEDAGQTDEKAASTESHHVRRNVFFGVDVPPSRTDEAEEVIEKAKSFISQGRKSNPYGKDRGKNAWRKALFNAVWADLAPVQATAVRDVRQPATVSVPGSNKFSATRRDDVKVDQEFAVSVAEDTDPMADPLANLASDEDIEDLEREALFDIDNDALPAEEEDHVDEGDILHDEADGESVQEDDFLEYGDGVDEGSHEGEDGSDPLDDLDDELPPVSTLPPPRGYPAGAVTVPDRVPNENNPVSREAAETRGPVPPAFRPSVSAPQSSIRTPPGGSPSITPKKAPGGTPIHVSMPIPENRRPASGQVLQQPPTLPPIPSIAASPPPTANRPPAAVRPAAKTPPAFMLKGKG